LSLTLLLRPLILASRVIVATLWTSKSFYSIGFRASVGKFYVSIWMNVCLYECMYVCMCVCIHI
jgi:hypothetical protein